MTAVDGIARRFRSLASATVAGEFVRYFAAGLVALAVDFALYVALAELAGWHYLLSATAAFCAGLATIYIFSVFWVFRARNLRRTWHEFAVFAAIGLVGLGLTALALFVLVEFFGVDYRISKIVAAALVFMFNFSFRKFFLFRSSPDS
jgi:putative flippase GtrA